MSKLCVFCSNPRNTDFTVSLWLRVNDAANSDCTVIASGRSNVDTGLNIILKDMAKVISAEIIAYDRYVNLNHVVGTSLEVWTHLALLHIDSTSGRYILQVTFAVFIQNPRILCFGLNNVY